MLSFPEVGGLSWGGLAEGGRPVWTTPSRGRVEELEEELGMRLGT